MQVDRQELQDHYAQLSDDELLDLDRAELTEAARKVYDAELAKRRLIAEEADSAAEPSGGAAPMRRAEDGEDQDAPDWLESAACAVAYTALPGGSAADAGDAHDALAAAGIPCHISLKSVNPDDPKAQYAYYVMVPGARNLEAASVLAMQIDNPKEEAMWRAHFEELSDEELRALKFEAICAGLRDRLARLKSAYDDEIARRKQR
jgi:hypothetical protein